MAHRRSSNPYRFIERVGNTLFWERTIPGDSRVEQVSCDADWFYGLMLP